jgi:hypothetical protein
MYPLRPRRQRGDVTGDPVAVGDFTQLALWMAASVAGMVTALILARGPFFESMLARLSRTPSKKAKKPTPEQSLPMLADAIIGSSKSAIASVFGPPRTADLPGIGLVVRPKVAFWQADTWYYPLPRNGPVAMAIAFDEDLAHQVEFFTAPQPPVSNA